MLKIFVRRLLSVGSISTKAFRFSVPIGHNLQNSTLMSISCRQNSFDSQVRANNGVSKSEVSWKMNDIERLVLRICQEYDKIRGSNFKNITLATDLIDDLGLDSLDHIEVLVAVENEFGIEIPEAELLPLKTIQSIVDYLVKNVQVKK